MTDIQIVIVGVFILILILVMVIIFQHTKLNKIIKERNSIGIEYSNLECKFEEMSRNATHYLGFYNASIKLVQQVKENNRNIKKVSEMLLNKLQSKLPKDDL